MHTRHVAALLILSLFVAAGADWSQWRGPLGTGHATQPLNVPTTWSADRNIAWKVALPGPGNSTPIVVAGRVLVTCASMEGRVRSLFSFDQRTGEQLWRRDVPYEAEELTHETNPACASSPVSDGQRVFVWHGSAGFFVYDLDGAELWRKDLGRFEHIWGYASSPVIVGDLVVLSAGPGLRAFVIAMDAATGEEIWRFEPRESISTKIDEFRGSWNTPVLAQIDGRLQLVLSLPQKLYGLDPASGAVIWSCDGMGDLAYTSPLIGDGLIVAMSGYHGPSMAVRTIDAKGDITATHQLWRLDQKPDNPQRVGSGVLVDGHVYIYNEPGIMWCIEAATGKRLWEDRLGGTSWCSAAFVDGRIYVSNEAGDTFVVAPDTSECRVLERNSLGELMRGSLAFTEGHIFARTYEHLYCIGAPFDAAK